MKIQFGKKMDDLLDGEYEAVVTEITESVNFKRKILVFTFQIFHERFNGYTVRGFVNGNYQSYSEHTKLYQWYAAAQGCELDHDSAEWDLENFKNKVLLIRVQRKKSNKTGNLFGNVTAIIRKVRDL